MRYFTNPLDKVRIASPCPASWDEMRGDEKKRFCAECKLNVYNLSGMTKVEAENFLINSEGRVCLKITRRADGSILTQDCPVGWLAVKRCASRMATAVAALVATILSGVLAFKIFNFNSVSNYENDVDEIEDSKGAVSFGLYGTVSNLPEMKIEILKSRNE